MRKCTVTFSADTASARRLGINGCNWLLNNTVDDRREICRGACLLSSSGHGWIHVYHYTGRDNDWPARTERRLRRGVSQ